MRGMEVLGYVGVMGLLIALTWKRYPDYSKPDRVTLKGALRTVATIAIVCLGIAIIHAL